MYLANGVTTLRDCGPSDDPATYILEWREKIKQGKQIDPTIYSAGLPLVGPVDDPRARIREQHAQGFDFIKLYSFLSADEFRQAMQAAKDYKMYTTGHIPFAMGLAGVVEAGMDEIAHIEELDFEFISFDLGFRGLGGCPPALSPPNPLFSPLLAFGDRRPARRGRGGTRG